MQGSVERQIGRLAADPAMGAVGETPSQEHLDAQRATAEHQRRLGSAFADALSAIKARVDRIETRPLSDGEGIVALLDEMRSGIQALVARDEGRDREAVAPSGARALDRETLVELVRKLEDLLVRLPATLDAASDRLAAAAAAMESEGAARAGADPAVEALRSEMEALKAAQAASEMRLLEALQRVEAAVVSGRMPDPQTQSGPGALRASVIAGARRAAELRQRAFERAPLKEEAPAEGIDLPRPAPLRSSGFGLVAGGAAVLVVLLYGAQFLSRPADKTPFPAAASVEAVTPPPVVHVESPRPVVQVPNAAGPAQPDKAALDEFASRLLRGDAIVRDRAIERPAAPKSIDNPGP